MLGKPELFAGFFLVEIFQRGFAAETDLAGAVDVDDLDRDVVAFLADVGDFADAVVGHLGDVEQTFLSGQDFHESAEVLDGNDLAAVDLADLGFAGVGFDFAFDFIEDRFVAGEDGDGAVVFDIDL